MPDNIKINSGKGKGKPQAVQGIQVFLQGQEFLFNYQTVNPTRDEEIEYLKSFRNRFVGELEQLNNVLGNISE